MITEGGRAARETTGVHYLRWTCIRQRRREGRRVDAGEVATGTARGHRFGGRLWPGMYVFSRGSFDATRTCWTTHRVTQGVKAIYGRRAINAAVAAKVWPAKLEPGRRPGCGTPQDVKSLAQIPKESIHGPQEYPFLDPRLHVPSDRRGAGADDRQRDRRAGLGARS